MKKGGAFRPKKIYFSQVSNYAIRDYKLSLKAKGLYSLIQSYITIENFILYKNTLKKSCMEGKDAFERAWKELKDKQYLLQHKIQDTETGLFNYEYELLDAPLHILVSRGVDNPLSGKVGGYNNKNLKNTDLKNTKDIYTILPDDEHVFIDIYKEYFKRYMNKDHMRIKKTDLSYILKCLNELVSCDVTEEYFIEGVAEHFETLPQSNNGNILAFLSAMKRYFSIDKPVLMENYGT